MGINPFTGQASFDYEYNNVVQYIVDTAQKVQYDRRKVVGQTLSRSQRIKSAERNTAVPFVLTVTPKPYFDLTIDRARELIEGVLYYDRYREFIITPQWDTADPYLTTYQGAANFSEQQKFTVTNFTNNLMTIGSTDNFTGIAINEAVFVAGDWVQPYWSRYPYIVQKTVLRGTGTTITLELNRPRITSEVTTITGATVRLGSETEMRMIIAELPTYEVNLYKQLSFSGDFTLVEKII